jgi:hypothetical protein
MSRATPSPLRTIPVVRALSLAGLVGLVLAGALLAGEPAVGLRLQEQHANDVTLRDLGKGVYEIRTTGTDPYVHTHRLPESAQPARSPVLSFEYSSSTGTNSTQVFLGPQWGEQNSVTGPGLRQSSGWASYTLDLRPVMDRLGGKVNIFRLDFGTERDRVVRLRSLRLVPAAGQPAVAQKGPPNLQGQEARLRNYLDQKFPCRVTRVEITQGGAIIEGEVGRERDGLLLAEIPVHADATTLTEVPYVEPLRPQPDGRFTAKMSRYRKQGDRDVDRVLSRWAVVREGRGGLELLAHARYADTVWTPWEVRAEKPRSKKGLGDLRLQRPLQDLDDLGIAGVTVNIPLNWFMRDGPGKGISEYPFGGRNWYVDDQVVGELDQTLREASRRGIIVSAIILLTRVEKLPEGAWLRRATHPDAGPPGIYVLPNVTSAEGLLAYAAGLDYLARRYSHPKSLHGRIHHWIVHNEVDESRQWTNAGDRTALPYMDLYHRSIRVAHLMARKFNVHAKTFIPLTNNWTTPASKHGYTARRMLELLLDYSRAEGDFDWGIAHHPYPEDTRNPRVWEDRQVNFTFDTPKLTMKNLEVLDAWVRQPHTLYLGKHPRTVHLSEQGLNAPDYSAKSLREQAAGLAYAWKKVSRLEAIEMFHYHNWVDARDEGGLRLGLRKYPDESGDPRGRKPIWSVYQALGTPREEEATAFARPIIGIRNWAEIRPRPVPSR